MPAVRNPLFHGGGGDGRDLYVVVCEDIYFVKILKVFPPCLGGGGKKEFENNISYVEMFSFFIWLSSGSVM